MKHFIALALGLTLVGTAQADYYREYRHHGHRPVIVERVQTGGEVLVPLLIGGMVGAAIANSNRPEPVVVQQQIVQPPVYVQPQPPQGFVQCPAGTMPFEQRGWVRNAYGQWIQAAYVECK